MTASEQSVAARINRLPVSSWHLKMRVIVGVATFFDAFEFGRSSDLVISTEPLLSPTDIVVTP